LTEYLHKTKRLAKKDGFTKTLFGRRRYFPGLNSKIPYIRAMAERMAINAPIQGTAADILKIAMHTADKELKKAKLKDRAHLILQIHDELIYEVEDKIVDQVIDIVNEAMEGVIGGRFVKGMETVPLEVKVSVGQNWQEMTDHHFSGVSPEGDER